VALIEVNDNPALGRRIKAGDVGSSGVAFTPDGRSIASAGEFGDVLEWDVARGVLSGEPFSGHERQVSSLSFTPDGKMLVSGAMDGSVIFWDAATHAALGPPVRIHRGPVWSLACSPDGKTAASSSDGEMVFWNLATREPTPPITLQKDRIWNLIYSSDGAYLVSAGNSHVMAIWRTANPAQPVRMLGTAATESFAELMPAGVAFSPDATLLAASATGNSINIWSVKSASLVPPALYGHTQTVTSLGFSRDGKVLVSGSADGRVRLFDVDSHELIGTLDPRQGEIKSVVFSPREDIMATSGTADSIVLWNVGFADWVTRACHIANRNLTRTEWRTYFGSSAYRKTCPDR
jgi:DNA-binding beta-propeller fold protein YncE